VDARPARGGRVSAVPAVQIIVPANWRTVAGCDLGQLTCEAATAGDALRWLAARHPPFGPRLFGQAGQLAGWVNIYLGDDDIRHASGLDTPVTAPVSLTIVPALAGG
jgi:molybdopterin converting factor small subunit